MKRNPEQTLAALENQIRAWASVPGQAEIRVLAYPPEWEALMLVRMRSLVGRLAEEGLRVAVEDVGQGFLASLERRASLVERLEARELNEEPQVVHDLRVLASRYLRDLFRSPVPPGVVCRLVVNTGTLAVLASYSTVMNELYGGRGEAGPGGPTVVAFPGEADDRSLNLLGLRRETDYRTARI